VGDIRLGAVAVDCADPAELSAFYRDVLDLELMFSSSDFVALQGAGVLLTFHRVADYQCPNWPVGPVPKQLHFDLAVSDLDAEESRILALGAAKADVQPQPEKWRVLIDPAGHPFCISSLIPDPA
jgi:catechol 2,3-dioxygenase-like lactoylglutathione lyase family enzyme